MDSRNRSHWRTRKENFKKIWDDNAKKSDPLILDSIAIESDGGLNDTKLRMLWPSDDLLTLLGRCSTAFNIVVVGLASIIHVIVMDYAVVVGKKHTTQQGRFLVLGDLFNFILSADEGEDRGEQLVISHEDGGLRWQAVGWLFWNHIPFLSSFTAMKLLYFVDPAVLLSGFYIQIAMFIEYWQHKAYWSGSTGLIWFIFTRVVFFSIGYDSFLIKVRVNMDNYIDKKDMSVGAVIGSLIFLFQILGVVNLTSFVKHRLFRFVFGGPDCVIDSEDKAKEWFWDAMLAKKIWQLHHPIKFFVVMLSFSDEDFQLLTIREKIRHQQEKEPGQSTAHETLGSDEDVAEVTSSSTWELHETRAPEVVQSKVRKVKNKKTHTKKASPGSKAVDEASATSSRKGSLFLNATSAEKNEVLDTSDQAIQSPLLLADSSDTTVHSSAPLANCTAEHIGKRVSDPDISEDFVANNKL